MHGLCIHNFLSCHHSGMICIVLDIQESSYLAVNGHLVWKNNEAAQEKFVNKLEVRNESCSCRITLHFISTKF